MKLLLTSAGFTNKSISNALLGLLSEKTFNNTKAVFVPTAANAEEGDKGWLIDDLINMQKLKFKEIDIVDFSALPKDMWLPRLKKSSVLVFSGGNTFHLIDQMVKDGLDKELKKLLRTRIYVGISAGSIIASRNLALSHSKRLYSETYGKIKGDKGLGFVNFHIRPHLNSPYFANMTLTNVKKEAKKLKEPVYAIDDQTAIKIIDDKIEIVSEGNWKLITE